MGYENDPYPLDDHGLSGALYPYRSRPPRCPPDLDQCVSWIDLPDSEGEVRRIFDDWRILLERWEQVRSPRDRELAVAAGQVAFALELATRVLIYGFSSEDRNPLLQKRARDFIRQMKLGWEAAQNSTVGFRREYQRRLRILQARTLLPKVEDVVRQARKDLHGQGEDVAEPAAVRVHAALSPFAEKGYRCKASELRISSKAQPRTIAVKIVGKALGVSEQDLQGGRPRVRAGRPRAAADAKRL